MERRGKDTQTGERGWDGGWEAFICLMYSHRRMSIEQKSKRKREEEGKLRKRVGKERG